MSSLLDRLSKVGGSKSVPLDESKVYKQRGLTTTPVPALNVALSGELEGGFGSGIGILAGPSKHFKSNTGIVLVKSYMQQNKDAICLFYDSEFGTPPEYWDAQGIDSSRILHIPILNIEELKFDLPQKLDDIKLGEKVIIFVDSIGNLASKKEIVDAMKEDAKTDMTRAKEMKSLFRIITPMIKMKNIPALFVAHTYQTMELYSKAVVSGGTGPYYSADWIIIFGRQQEKDASQGEGVTGFSFILNNEKSRFVREKAKTPLTVSFKKGIHKYSGMLDLAMDAGEITKPKNKHYALVDKETGEIGEAVHEDDVETDEFLGVVLKRQTFADYITSVYKFTGEALIDETEEV